MPIVIATPNADGEVPWLDMFIVVDGENKKIKAIHAVPKMVTPKGDHPGLKRTRGIPPGAG